MSTPPRIKVADRDGVWLQESPRNRMLINTVFTFDRMELEELRELWQSRIMASGRFPRFKRRVVEHRGGPCWEDDPSFDVGRHIVLAPPLHDDPDALSTREKLQDYLSRQASTPLPADRPPWLMQLVPGYRGRAGMEVTVLYIRIHHVMADGMALLPVIFSLMDPGKVSQEDMERANKLVSKAPSGVGTVLKTILLGPLLLLQKMLWRKDRSLLHGPPLSGEKRLAWMQPIDVARIKEVKNAYGATINDVLMTAMAAGIESYARERGETLRTLRMSMPVNVRPITEEPRMENKFAAVMLDLPVGSGGPRESLQAMKRYLDRVKGSVEPLFTYGTVLVLLALLPARLSSALIDWLANKCSCVISNVPGPPGPIFLGGQRLRSMMFWVPQRADIAVGVSIMSFDGRLSVGIIADTAVVPEPEHLIDAFRHEIERLRREAGLEVDG